jgi:hypothetical protein
MSRDVYPTFGDQVPGSLLPSLQALDLPEVHRHPNAQEMRASLPAVGRNATAVATPDCDNYISHLTTIIPGDVLAQPCEYDQNKKLGIEIAIAIGKYRNLSNYRIPETVQSNRIYVGRHASNPEKTLTNFKNSVASGLILCAVFGVHQNNKKLSGFAHSPLFNSVVNPLIQFFVNHLNPFRELRYEVMVESDLGNFDRNVKSKVKTYGIWNATYITNPSFQTGENMQDNEVCRGLDVFLATIADWIVSEDLCKKVHDHKMFVPARMATHDYWLHNKVWKYHPYNAIVDPAVVRLMQFSPTVPTLRQLCQLDMDWVPPPVVMNNQPRLPVANPQRLGNAGNPIDLHNNSPVGPGGGGNAAVMNNQPRHPGDNPPAVPGGGGNADPPVDPPLIPQVVDNADPPDPPEDNDANNDIPREASEGFTEAAAQRRRLIRNTLLQRRNDAPNDVSLSDEQISVLETRPDRIQQQFQNPGIICAICRDSETAQHVGNPPVFATGENCNCLFHRYCLLGYIRRRFGPDYPRSGTNHCPICRRFLSRTVPVTDHDLGLIMDVRTEEEVAQDLTNLLNNSFSNQS